MSTRNESTHNGNGGKSIVQKGSSGFQKISLLKDDSKHYKKLQQWRKCYSKLIDEVSTWPVDRNNRRMLSGTKNRREFDKIVSSVKGGLCALIQLCDQDPRPEAEVLKLELQKVKLDPDMTDTLSTSFGWPTSATYNDRNIESKAEFLNEWPPEGYITIAQIEKMYDVKRTTFQSWFEKGQPHLRSVSGPRNQKAFLISEVEGLLRIHGRL